MNRAGLLNFWYYDDEVFDFADGKLLLRGSNGSGKSVTMQSILPILLDGKKSPDRLDPFRSRARKIEDYLLGEKEVVDRDERTGYLFLEYKRANTNQYITTGIGLQARRHKKLNFWGFVITDNRRIGEDFFLYEVERNAGERQQIPLSRIQLENRIASGGHVVQTQGDYMKLVNKYIFGFESMEAYGDLIELLIQLRSPKLSKDFRPTVIYDILEAALPPLTDEDLRHLSDTIEHMDQTKQQIEQLEREQQALEKVTQHYHAYNEFRLQETAIQYKDAKRKLKKESENLQETNKTLEELDGAIEKMASDEQTLERQKDVLDQKQERLREHKVWNLEAEKTKEIEAQREIQKDILKKDESVTEKTKREFQLKETLDKLEIEIVELGEEMTNRLMDLETDAAETSFERHDLNAEDFERHMKHSFDFTLWKKEAEQHYNQLQAISEKLQKYNHLKQQMADTEKLMADTQMEVDILGREKKDWENIFEKDKQDKLTEIHEWTGEYDILEIRENPVQEAARQMANLYELTTFEAIRTPFLEQSQTYQMKQKEMIATKNSERKQLQEKMEEQNDLLHEWKNMRDPEPPHVSEETKEARNTLQAAGVNAIPLYEAVEFQDHVEEETRKHIEAALMDSGLLNALITEEDFALQHDRVLKRNPQMMAHTLADFVVPDDKAETKIQGATIDEVLRSIVIDDPDLNEEGLTGIGTEGTYQLGLVKGHAVPVEKVRFIGRSARKRYKEEKIASILSLMEQLEEEKSSLENEVQALEEKVREAQQAMENFPDDQDLQVSYAEIQKRAFNITQLEKQIMQYDEKLSATRQAFQTVKRTLDEATRGLDIAFTYEAYQEATTIQRRYEKEVSELEKHHLSYSYKQRNFGQTELRKEELEIEVNELKGELNLLKDKESKITHNIAEIDNQLQAQGMDDIRRQIQEVQQAIHQTEQDLNRVRKELPVKRAKKDTLENTILEQQQKVHFQDMLVDTWKAIYEAEWQFGFLDTEEMDIEAYASSVRKESFAQKDLQKIESQLTKVYYDQHQNLMEYRMTDQTMVLMDTMFANEDWTEDQQIVLENVRAKASRRLLQLDFQGKKLTPYAVLEIVEEDRSRQQTMLNDQDKQLYEEILFDSVGKKLRSRIYRAQEWTKKMNNLMVNSDSTSGITFSIQWKPRTAETEAELDTKELVELLRRDPRLLKEEDLNEVMNHFRSKIERAKELIEIRGEGDTLLQVLKDVLDYRYWFSFQLSFQRLGETKRELTNNAFYKFSGGEKAMAMYIPLFTACYSRYLEADDAAPYIISLDEAFAGVDDENIRVMFRLVEDLGFDYMMNSQVLWGDYDTVPSLAIYELIRPKNADFVSVMPHYWNGKQMRQFEGELELVAGTEDR